MRGEAAAPFRRLGVIGAGAWGTALAQVGARAGLAVRLWAHEPDVARTLAERRENPAYLPGVRLEDAVTPTADPGELFDADLVLAACPAQHLRATLGLFAGRLRSTAPIVLCAKGVEQGSLKLMSAVAAEVAPDALLAVLSGPSFAAEVACGLPCAVTLACADLALGDAIARAIALPSFRPYVAGDVIGAEAGGAVKNVLAIACGVVEGRGLGRSAHAGLITRGFAEMTRLGMAMGARAETLAGLCGLGDLVLTCSSPLSRNMSLGIALGRGETLDQALAGKRAVVEGLSSAPAVCALAARLGVQAPICEAVARVTGGEIDVEAAIDSLLSRPLRMETLS